MPVSPARAAAFDILLRVDRDRAYASELLHAERTAELSPADRALCMEMVMGVLRWRQRLDFGLGEVVTQPLAKLDLEVLTALRLAAYQIGFLRVPARAAVNESVELVKRARKRSAAPLVNAVLRKLTRELLQPLLAPGAKTVLDLAPMYSHPSWLVERWAARFGMETAETICAGNQQTPVPALRVRGRHTDEALRAQGIDVSPGALLTSARRIRRTRRGEPPNDVVFQDEASQLVALLVGRGERILDCCAAPGGKTAILAERNPRSQVIAAELHWHRARRMKDLLGITAPAAVQEGAAAAGAPAIVVADAIHLPFRGQFDRVLADVPCSGTGTLARNPEIKWRLNADHLPELHALQVGILRSAMQALAPGGRLVYSTCSLEPEENAAVVEEALREAPEFRLHACGEELERLRAAGELAWSDVSSLVEGRYLRTLPGVHPCDGFFAGIVVRSS